MRRLMLCNQPSVKEFHLVGSRIDFQCEFTDYTVGMEFHQSPKINLIYIILYCLNAAAVIRRGIIFIYKLYFYIL